MRGGILKSGPEEWAVLPRDRHAAYITWEEYERNQELCPEAHNARFLILTWARVPHLASHLLGRLARRLPRDWQQRYCIRPVLLETFRETARFRGTCYRAANWIHVGRTQGRGKLDVRKQYPLPVKDILLKPLHPCWRSILNR